MRHDETEQGAAWLVTVSGGIDARRMFDAGNIVHIDGVTGSSPVQTTKKPP